PLVGHGAAPHLASVKGLPQLVHLRLLEESDLVGDLPQRPRHLDEQAPDLRDAVAGRVPRDPGHAEAETGEGSGLDAEALLTEAGEGPDRAREVPDEDPRLGLPKPLGVAVQLVDPHRDLVAEGERERLLAVGPAGHQGVAVPAGEGGEGAADRPEVAPDEAPGLA